MQIRRKVMLFAEAMERKLQANKDKGGWGNCDSVYLWERLHAEVDEFVEAIAEDGNALEEAADVANFLMMLCDVNGHLNDNHPDHRR